MKAFIIEVETPPGLPWTQEKVARLEAQHRSPMASDQAQVLLRRTEAWRVGAPGRFCAALIRKAEALEGVDAVEVEVDGKMLPFPVHGSSGLRSLVPAAIVCCVLCLATAVGAVAISKAISPPPAAMASVEVGGSGAFPRPANDQFVEDLLAVREAFSGQGLRAVQWRKDGVVVLTDRSDRDAATGRGRAFRKLATDLSEDVDRWRLDPARRTP